MEAWQGNNTIAWMGYDNHENLWCLLENVPGLWILDKNLNPRIYKNPLLEDGSNFNSGITKLLFDTDDVAWCATNKGLYRMIF